MSIASIDTTAVSAARADTNGLLADIGFATDLLPDVQRGSARGSEGVAA